MSRSSAQPEWLIGFQRRADVHGRRGGANVFWRDLREFRRLSAFLSSLGPLEHELISPCLISGNESFPLQRRHCFSIEREIGALNDGAFGSFHFFCHVKPPVIARRTGMPPSVPADTG